MPIVVKDFVWRQTPNTVVIQVPLKGVHQSKVDIFTSRSYIKASYKPFFFEAFPLEAIDPLESKCTLTTNEIVFELFKIKAGDWSSLEIDLPKQEKNRLKKELIEEEHKRFQDDCKEKVQRKHALKKLAVREQMEIDTKQRAYIENVKNTEKKTALGDLDVWKKEINPEERKADLSSSESEEEIIAIPTKKIPRKIPNYIPKYNLKKIQSNNIPLPRKTSSIAVEFTERELPTPSRESRLAEEEEWFRKQAEVRRSVGFDSDDLRPEEKNPMFLKSKGDEFLKNENYLGAISAYTFGLKLCDKYVDLYIKRSEAHFMQGNMQRTITDCSTALELLKPECSANFLDRVTCIVRRGRALFKFGMREKAFREIEIAYKMQPDREDLKDLLIEMMDEMNNSTTEDINDVGDPLIEVQKEMRNLPGVS
nr:dynein assembly factor 4, axonemal-like [Onthophagus taurus]